MFESKPIQYQGVCYQIEGSEEYRFIIRLRNRLISSESFASVVGANQAARKRIDALTALQVKLCQ